MSDEADYKSADTAELEDIRASFAGSARRRLVMWAVRWTLGFAAIGVAVYFRPQWAWLWWAGAAVAALSLALMLVVRWLTLRRIDAARRRIEGHERAAREADRP